MPGLFFKNCSEDEGEYLTLLSTFWRDNSLHYDITCRGQCYNDGSNMLGKNSGVAKQIFEQKQKHF